MNNTSYGCYGKAAATGWHDQDSTVRYHSAERVSPLTRVAYQPGGLPGVSRLSTSIPHLVGGFPLRCFQRLSLPYVATQLWPWQANWITRGTSNPILSY